MMESSTFEHTIIAPISKTLQKVKLWDSIQVSGFQLQSSIGDIRRGNKAQNDAISKKKKKKSMHTNKCSYQKYLDTKVLIFFFPAKEKQRPLKKNSLFKVM